MSEPIFGHERLNVYRLASEYVATSYRQPKLLNGPERHARVQWYCVASGNRNSTIVPTSLWLLISN